MPSDRDGGRDGRRGRGALAQGGFALSCMAAAMEPSPHAERPLTMGAFQL
jgi:hypothetical protein